MSVEVLGLPRRPPGVDSRRSTRHPGPVKRRRDPISEREMLAALRARLRADALRHKRDPLIEEAARRYGIDVEAHIAPITKQQRGRR